ncbi:helix-turn-helix domain-containing protein [Streptomyces xantholiticus]
MTSAAGASVPRRGPKLEPLLLSDDERAVLERWTRRASSAQAVALRARIVLACAGPEVPPIVAVARELRVAADTVRKWRRRFLVERLDGLVDEPRPGRPPTISVDQVEAVVVTTLEEIPKNATHWSRKSMAEHSGLSKSTVGRIWRKFQLKPHLSTHKTPAIRTWLAKHPRFHMHFTPTGSSWINQVERWFGFLADQKIRRGAHKNVQTLEADIRAWVKDWNADPKPFIWTKTAEEILDSLARFCRRISGAGH